jgi:hypothetical protein
VTYLQPPVAKVILDYAVPVQFDNSKKENNQFLHSIHHIWTPDVRILGGDGYEFYRFDGFLPPPEFMARTLCGFAMGFLRLKRFDRAEEIYVDVLKRFPPPTPRRRRSTISA